MIILHRITPFLIGIVTALAFFSLIVLRWNPVAVMVPVALTVAALLARLVEFRARSFQSWMFWGTPMLFLASSFGLTLLLERSSALIALAAVATGFTFFFAENVFAYVHAPLRYETYAIENLSLVMNVASLFFLGVVAYGMRVHLSAFAPLWLLAPLFAAVALFSFYGTLWASKVDASSARVYSACGALLVAELFVAVAYLPTGYYTSAVLVALTGYLFLVLTRARFVEKLSATVVGRYLALATAVLVAVLGTSQWT